MSSPGPRPTEQVWNTGGGLGLLGPGIGAGGGGISSFWSMPSYQSQASPALNVIGPDSSPAPCGAMSVDCRQVPDVSADADPNTGYLIYWNGGGSVTGSQAGWVGIGGTSAASPLWAAVIALANASRGCNGSAIGFANPGLYRAASLAYAGDFNDIVSGNNDLTGTNGGKDTARPGYDLASGLGTPNVAALAGALCPDTIRITNPGAQMSALGTALILPIAATDSAGARLSYAAAGLPAGLSIDPSSGRIAGRPIKVGTFTVSVLAVDANGATAAVSFPCTIAGPPTTSPAALAGLTNGRPKLAFAVSAGPDAAPLISVTITLPTGLRFSTAAKLLTVTGAGGRRLSFSARSNSNALTITLLTPAPAIQIAIGYPKLTAAPSLTLKLRHHQIKTLTTTVALTDARRQTSRLRLTIRPHG